MKARLVLPHFDTKKFFKKSIFGMINDSKKMLDLSKINFSLNYLRSIPITDEHLLLFNNGIVGFVPFRLKSELVLIIPEGEYSIELTSSGEMNAKLTKTTSPFVLVINPPERVQKLLKSETKKTVIQRVVGKNGYAFSLETFLADVNGTVVSEENDEVYVRWNSNGQYNIHSRINKTTGKVIEAGFCLSGNDQKLHAYMLKAIRNKWDDLRDGEYFKGVIQ